MFRDGKNLKDSKSTLPTSLKDSALSVSYPKTNKLIAALYMVTDILDREEPMRAKLRTLGTEVVSDIHISPSRAGQKIKEVLSFLDIISMIGMISEMNCNILKKEFTELDESIKKPTRSFGFFNGEQTLTDFMKKEESQPKIHTGNKRTYSIGHKKPTNLGVQEAGTFMKVLSDTITTLSDTKEQFNLIKKERRNQILDMLKENLGGFTITDIKLKSTGALANCGEKTLQRELVSMVKDGTLKKTGEKRWSRYFLADKPSVTY